MSDGDRFAPPRGRKEVKTPTIMTQIEEVLRDKCGDWSWLDSDVLRAAKLRLGQLLDEARADREEPQRQADRIRELEAEVKRLRQFEPTLRDGEMRQLICAPSELDWYDVIEAVHEAGLQMGSCDDREQVVSLRLGDRYFVDLGAGERLRPDMNIVRVRSAIAGDAQEGATMNKHKTAWVGFVMQNPFGDLVPSEARTYIKADHDRIRELETEVGRLREAVHAAAHEAHTSGRIYGIRNGKEGCSSDEIDAIERCAERHIAAAQEARDDG